MSDLPLPPILARGTRLVTKVEATEETGERNYPAGSVAIVGTSPETPEGIYRDQFQSWAKTVAARFGYTVEFSGIGPEAEGLGGPTQMGVFRRPT